MNLPSRARIAVALFLLLPVLSLNCNAWAQVPTIPTPVAQPDLSIKSPTPVLIHAAASVESTPSPVPQTVPTAAAQMYESAGEPAGCLSAADQSGLTNIPAMLSYADRLLELPHPLSSRILPASWNAYTRRNDKEGSVVSLSVGDVQNTNLIQHFLNALHVAGFVTWLRNIPAQGLQILAIPLLDPAVLTSPWAPYIQPYWQTRSATPSSDTSVISALKLPPCAWMVSRGFAPRIDFTWWASDRPGWPDYAQAADAYLAPTNDAAVQVAKRIGWLGKEGEEGPNTMCGPLAWAILNDAGAFPPDWGGWSDGPRTFWLAKPRTNGRPWSLFPSAEEKVYSFRKPLGTFDFSQFPLYPGDFLYTYSEGDGFDHMLVVTDVDADGNVYTVTNIIHMVPVKKVTIERVLLLNLNDPTAGIARNEWAKDRVNGRTGHHGFDVFRWAWAEKDIRAAAAAYTVQPGDTPGLIAARWKTPVDQIARYNEITVDASLSIGQQLSIPPNERKGR